MKDDIKSGTGHDRTFVSPTTSPSASGENCQPYPVYLRLPKPGTRCSLTGLSRASLNELILGPNPRVASIVVRKKGATRGVRLIRTSSLLGYLDRLQREQANEENQPESNYPPNPIPII